MNEDLKPPRCDDSMDDQEGGFYLAMLIVLRLRDDIMAAAENHPIPKEHRSMVAGALQFSVDLIKEVADAWKEKECS